MAREPDLGEAPPAYRSEQLEWVDGEWKVSRNGRLCGPRRLACGPILSLPDRGQRSVQVAADIVDVSDAVGLDA